MPVSHLLFDQATSVAHAIELLNTPGLRAQPVAGGTDLVVAMRQRGPWFDRLVDISAIPELREIVVRGDQIRLGACVTFARAAAHPQLRALTPMLAEACLSIGGPQIQNVGTVGGNVANAAACADTLPVLVALDAQAHIAGAAGERVLPVSELIIAPHHTALQQGELLTAFSFAAPPAGARSIFIKVRRRNAQAISRLSVAAIGHVDAAGLVDHVRLAVGAALPRPQRLTAVEALVHGQRPAPGLYALAGAQAVAVMLDITGRRWSTEYKEVALSQLAPYALARVLEDAPLPTRFDTP